jgi:hypothetical protein
MTMPSPNQIHIDGEALARARRSSKTFDKLVQHLRSKGATDNDIVQAMTSAKTIVSPLRLRGGRR